MISSRGQIFHGDKVARVSAEDIFMTMEVFIIGRSKFLLEAPRNEGYDQKV